MGNDKQAANHVARGNGYIVSRDLKPRFVSTTSLTPLGREIRKHPAKQVRKLAASLDQFGFVLPVVIDQALRVVAGWGLVLAARQLGLAEVPAVTVADLSEAKLRALRVALNRIGEDSSWDREALKIELTEILELALEIDLQDTGFEIGETDSILGGDCLAQEDELPTIVAAADAITCLGDEWVLGDHRLLCGNSLVAESYARVLGTEKARMMFADLVVGSGDHSSAEFLALLKAFFRHAAGFSTDGAIHFVCTDWQHAKEGFIAGEEVYGRPEDLCIWSKANAGKGSLYHRKHELIFAFKVGNGALINNMALGRHRRNRTNVWDYGSESTLARTDKSEVARRRTVKPVAMIADAVRDCTNPGAVILDPFGGTGTTIIAAERTGRRARVIELDPHFVDVSVVRWQRLTGRTAVHAATGRPFGLPCHTSALRCQSAPSADIAKG